MIKNASKIFSDSYYQHYSELKKAIEEIPLENIQKAIEAFMKCRGKVIFTGIGKSGIIAKKCAATFSSMGTPSIFLHSGEALHGDLGVVEKGDLICAIAKSGESEEIITVVRSIRKMGNTIISILTEPSSTLGELTDIIIPAKVTREAEKMNLAPTASTTVAVAIGDSLAATLASLRNFRPENFGKIHPSGQLGRRLLLQVKDILHPINPIIHIEKSMLELLEEESKPNLGGIMIVDDKEKLIGLVTDGDLRRGIIKYKNILDCKIVDIMTKNPLTIEPDILALHALKLMEERRSPISLLPVIDPTNKPIGLLRLHDLLNARIGGEDS